MHKHLISAHDVGHYARPCDMDEPIIYRAIEEAELLDVRPKLGAELFGRLLEQNAPAELLDGGEYTDRCGTVRSFVGLRRALAYYVWARLVKTGVNHLTRFGFVQKRDEYSEPTAYNERQVAYNDAFAIADEYMRGCIEYIEANPETFPDYILCGRVSSNRVKFKILGD